MPDLDQIVKAYDIRGTYPEQLDDSVARGVGAAFVRMIRSERTAVRTDTDDTATDDTATDDTATDDTATDDTATGNTGTEGTGAPGTGGTDTVDAAGDGKPMTVVVGHDMRPSSQPLVAAFTAGAVGQGADVVNVGLVSTDALYFASGSMDAPGAMFTASHNPAQYNGIKLCRAGAAPVGTQTGLAEIKSMVAAGVPDYDGPPGAVSARDILAEYAAYLTGLVDLSGIRPLTVVVDAGNGMGGRTAPVVLADLPLRVVPLYFDLDGTFPHHEANPIDPANLVDLQEAVLAEAADVGLAFDGDADRCFVVDERGEVVTPSTLAALIAVRELARVPGASIIHNLITSRAVAEVVRENGGEPIRTRVGHSFIKQVMAETGAVFGGEHSGHFYFRDFWRADSGMLAALHVLSALGHTPEGTALSSLLTPFDRYAVSGEVNSTVADAADRMAAVLAAFESEPEVTVDHLDGLTVNAADWWFNLRASNTEPLLRLNVEAVDAPTVTAVVDRVLAIVREEP